jgi:hypothetical protein
MIESSFSFRSKIEDLIRHLATQPEYIDLSALPSREAILTAFDSHARRLLEEADGFRQGVETFIEAGALLRNCLDAAAHLPNATKRSTRALRRLCADFSRLETLRATFLELYDSKKDISALKNIKVWKATDNASSDYDLSRGI